MGITYSDSMGVLAAPKFLSATSPRMLRREMIKNNVRLKAYVLYTDIRYVESEGKWYAWYISKPDDSQSIADMVVEAVE